MTGIGKGCCRLAAVNNLKISGTDNVCPACCTLKLDIHCGCRYFAWMAKEPGAFSKIIAAGIAAVSVMSSVLLFDHLRLYDFVIDGVLIYILFFKKIKRSQKRKDWNE